MTEKWKAVPGTEGRYSISNFGRVRSYAGRKPRILKTHAANQRGDYAFFPCVNNKRQIRYVAKAVVRAFLGVEPSKTVRIKHKDGDLSNNHVDNLFVVERSN